jgi:NADH dehydrogenase FAD-containing subunit
MGPGLLGGTYSWEQICLPVEALARHSGVTFVQGAVSAVDPGSQTVTLHDGRTLDYDMLSVNTGSTVGDPELLSDPRLYTVKPITELKRLRSGIEETSSLRVAVVGGGPAGVECAGNTAFLLHKLVHRRAEVQLYTRSERLARMTTRRSRWLSRFLKRHGVSIYHEAVARPSDIDADFVILATGTRPPESLTRYGLPLGPSGGIAVGRTLQSEAYANVFAVGDCADFLPEPLDRVGVYAVRMQQVLLVNMISLATTFTSGASEREAQLEVFTGTGAYLAGVNVGFGNGLLYRGAWSVRGPLAFRLKDYIDRRFMRRYRV